MKNIYIAILLTLAFAVTVWAQTSGDKETEGSLVIERVIVRGNRRFTESEIKSWISTRRRGVYQPQTIDRDVRALYETGHFEDVKVYVEEGLRGGKIVTFEVSERLLIRDVSYDGMDSSQRSEVVEELSRQKIDLSNDSEYVPAKVKLAASIIEKVLTKIENRTVKVIPYVERYTATECLITFKVESGSQK